MNASKTAVLVDSACDIDEADIERYQIKIVRLKVIYPEKVYSDGLDIDPMMIYDRFPGTIPRTSMANPEDISVILREIQAEGYENVIGITISSALSGTNNAMRIAFNEQTALRTYLFDSKNISIGAGIYAIWTCRKLEGGAGFEEVTKRLGEKINDCKLAYYMDTLDYLAKGGRITPSVAIVGKVLHLKPIISCNKEGAYYTAATIRGSGKGLKKLLDLETQAARGMTGKIWAAIMNGKAVESAAMVREMLLERIPDIEIIVEKQITATMAVHTGPGLVGLCLFSAD